MSKPLTDKELAALRRMAALVADDEPSTSWLAVKRLLVTLDARPALDVETVADGVRYAGGNGTSDYWRGFNDGIDRLAAALGDER